MSWREKHKAQMYYLRELVQQARLYATSDEDRLEQLAGAALDYADAVRRLAGTERSR